MGVIPQLAECFQHREVADVLDTAMAEAETAALRQVLSGTGGMGKTQLAAQYAATAWRTGSVEVLVWVGASSRDAILSAYAQAGVKLDGAPSGDPQQAATRFLSWLQTHPRRRWLIVLDDVGGPADLRDLWPPRTPAGRVLITTRNRDVALLSDGRHAVEVGVFTAPEAEAYLAAKLAAHGRHDEPDQIKALARDLGQLPLALSQTAAYITNLHLDCAAYRWRLADKRRSLSALFPDTTGLPDEQRHTLAATWALSVECANRLQPTMLARPMLQLAAMLDPNGIPVSVLTDATALAYLGTQASRAAVDADSAADTMRNLQQLSLVDYDPETPNRMLRIHNLIQRATRETLGGGERARAAQVAADALAAVWPVADQTSGLAEILRANTAALVESEPDALWENGVHPVLLRAGESQFDAGLLLLATATFERLEARASAQFGSQHPDVLRVRRHLAVCRGVAGDADGAVRTLDALLADCERILGPDHW